jgi:hypothetical protein
MTDIPQPVADVLRDVMGLQEPNGDDPFHRKLWQAVVDAGPGASYGARVVALKFAVNWELVDAGHDYAVAKTDYEAAYAKVKTRWLVEPKMSVAKAEALADADPDIYGLKLKYRLAELREQAMRKFLDTLSGALENHRTDRADQRAGDRAEARGFGGGL